MARLTKVYNTDDDDSGYVGRRNLPLVAGDKLMMLMDLNSKGLVIDSPMIRGRDLEEFSRKFKLLTEAERRQSLEIDSESFMMVLNQCVQCVGCRRRVERLFHQLTESGHRTLDPLELRPSATLGIVEEKLKTPQALGTLLYRHHEVLNNLLDNKLRNKTRCVLHSLDAFRAKPFSETWREVWSAMKSNCRNELTIIETKELHDVLENYLKKHKFCSGCRTKIERAYKILIGEVSAKEKGYAAQLYAHIRKCVPDQHIHVSTNKIEFLDALIKRAEPEVNGSYSKLRERHAKTLEIAQEEVLTCVGMIMYERLRRIYVSLREEERACQVLAAVGVHALCRSFDTFVEQKQGISNLELLYQEISRAERAKQIKREQKKLKKKKKKDEKKNMLHRPCEDTEANEESDEEEEEEELEKAELDQEEEEIHGQHEELSDPGADDGIVIEAPHPEPEPEPTSKPTKSKPKKQAKKKKQKPAASQKAGNRKQVQPLGSIQPLDDDHDHLDVDSCISSSVVKAVGGGDKCEECLAPMPNCPCEQDVRDSGYGSDPTSHADTPEGSEVSCSDGLCNHDGHDEDSDGLAARNSYVSDLLFYGHQSQFSLLQMWDDFDEYDEKDEESYYIPQEVVLAFKCHREQVQRKREQLRATLRANFERLCLQRGVQTQVPESKRATTALAAH
ncbi:gametogenetin-binding protein 2-like [Drosophila gunungcola]|uniref:gametogenetin-binding protein 2-like n=1 Tax=Drosophila gunungcola TaxID=103775 RepID=UPI0022DEA7CF|nr:gametogenetin-binding protein 2-like [Drosophila gunungcola]